MKYKRLEVNGKPTRIWWVLLRENPWVVSFYLPNCTLKLDGAEITCGRPDEAANMSIWADRLYKTGASAMKFLSKKNGGQEHDVVELGFTSKQKMLAALPKISGILLEFADNVNPDGSLKNPDLRLIKNQDANLVVQMRRYTQRLIDNGEDPPIAYIKGVLWLFNKKRAQVDGGEVAYEKFDQRSGTLSIIFKGRCGSDCPSTEHSQNNILGMMQHFQGLPRIVKIQSRLVAN